MDAEPGLGAAKCGGRNVDVRPNWKEAPGMVTDWRGVMAKWRVSYLGRVIGTVEAPDEKSAVARAMKTFHVTLARRFLIKITEVKE